MRSFGFVVVILMSFFLAGCGWFRQFHFQDHGALIEAKERAIISKPMVEKQNGVDVETFRVCAEPSPDALSAYAAELAAEVDIPAEVAIGIAGAFQESSSFVGLRTQSIQLLRDNSYRLCEAYLNEAITEEQYQLLMRRQQRNIVALLAIEQLTGALRVPPVTINTESSAESIRDLENMQKKKEDLENKITTKKDALKNLGTAESTEKDKLETEIEELEKNLTTVKDNIANKRTLIAGGKATATLHTVGDSNQRSDEHIQKISKTVAEIVGHSQDEDDFASMCLIHYERGRCKTFEQDLFCFVCKDRLEATSKAIKADASFKNTLGAAISNVAKNKKTTAKDLERLLNIFSENYEKPGRDHNIKSVSP
jgi:hypothetical protein